MIAIMRQPERARNRSGTKLAERDGLFLTHGKRADEASARPEVRVGAIVVTTLGAVPPFRDRLLRRENGVRLRRSGRSEQDDPSINDHARGRLARRTATSRFSRRIFQDHAQASSSDMGTPERNATPISTSTRLKSKASASACTASTLRRARLDMLLAAERVHHGRLETLAQRQNLVVSAPASRAAQDRHGTEQGEGRADRSGPPPALGRREGRTSRSLRCRYGRHVVTSFFWRLGSLF